MKEGVYSGVGYGKMDYPHQRAIYHCQWERRRETEEKGQEPREAKAWGKKERTGLKKVRDQKKKKNQINSCENHFIWCTPENDLQVEVIGRSDREAFEFPGFNVLQQQQHCVYFADAVSEWHWGKWK